MTFFKTAAEMIGALFEDIMKVFSIMIVVGLLVIFTVLVGFCLYLFVGEVGIGMAMIIFILLMIAFK